MRGLLKGAKVVAQTAMGGTLGQALSSPGMAYGAALGVGALAGPLAGGVRDEVLKDSITAKRAVGAFEAQEALLTQQLKAERYQRLVAQNTARLAASDPELYNNVLAGRRLPMDAVRIGGPSRTDLMEELAMAMGRGEFSRPQTAQDAAIQSLMG